MWDPDAGSHSLLFRAGRSLGESGQVAPAIHHSQALYATAVQRLGPDHPRTLTTRHNLAYWRERASNPAGKPTEDLGD